MWIETQAHDSEGDWIKVVDADGLFVRARLVDRGDVVHLTDLESVRPNQEALSILFSELKRLVGTRHARACVLGSNPRFKQLINVYMRRMGLMPAGIFLEMNSNDTP